MEGVDSTEEKTLEKAAKRAEEEGIKGDVRLSVCLTGIVRLSRFSTMQDRLPSLIIRIHSQLLPEKSITQINPSDSIRSYQLNTLSHLLFYKHFVPFIPSAIAFKKLSSDWDSSSDPAKGLVRPDGGVCMSLSARVGSIGDNSRGGWYSYRSTKSALNQAIHCLDLELQMKKSSALALAYHPGTVLTPFTKPIIGDKGGKSDPSKGLFTPEEGREKMVEVLKKANREDGWGGGFYDWKGERIPW